MKIETKSIHSGYSPDPTTKSVATPIYQTTSFAFDNAQHGAELFSLQTEGNIYSRIMNPTNAILEERLADLGAKKLHKNQNICSLEFSAPKNLQSDQKLNLYYYPSLNSPYTFVSTKRVRQMREDYPVNLITKPVLPMLMRMMTIPGFKAKYIISDAAREGRRHNHEMKSIYSPIGKPARKSYSLFPIIDEAGKGFEYIEALLKASFQDGINIGDESFLQNVVTDLGLDWQVIKKDLNTKRWKKILNDNVEDMYAGNCWGVPSFKITDQDGGNPFYVWGQDRMWLLKEEIFKRLGGSL